MNEFLELLNGQSGIGSSLVYGDWEDFLYSIEDEEEEEDDDQETMTVNDFAFTEKSHPLAKYKVECVGQHGGEGQGDTIYAVYSVEKDGVHLGFFKALGWYASHYGADFQRAFEVKPQEKTITVYEALNKADDEDE